MTMKYAIVPVIGEYEVSGNRTGIEVGGVFSTSRGYFLSAVGGGKLTRKQIETMAKARYKSKQYHVEEFSGFRWENWDQLDADTIELEISDMIAAVHSVGFGVEGE